MLLIGHRGAPAYKPENTIPSFRKALELGCNAVELDIHLCRSGELIVIHDETLDRTTGCTGKIADMTLLELKAIDGHISTLDEVLRFINCRMKVFIEIKDKSAAKAVAECVKDNVKNHSWNYDDLIVISFYHDTLKEIQRLDNNIKIGASFENEVNFDDCDLIADAIIPNIDTLTIRDVTNAHSKNIKVYTWTVRTVEQLQKAIALKVDGVMLDDPAMFFK